MDELPPGLLAYSAIVRGDEPIDPAFDYARAAAGLLADALDDLRDDDGAPIIPAGAFAKLTEVHLFLLALALAADDSSSTARNLAFPKRRGRPRKSIEKIGEYRKAARMMLDRASAGYDAALVEVAKETGLDKTEIEGWAAKIKADEIAFGLRKK